MFTEDMNVRRDRYDGSFIIVIGDRGDVSLWRG